MEKGGKVYCIYRSILALFNPNINTLNIVVSLCFTCFNLEDLGVVCESQV